MGLFFVPTINQITASNPMLFRLGMRTIPKSSKSYMSTKYPRDAMITGKLNRISNFSLVEKVLICFVGSSAIDLVAGLFYIIKL